MEEEEIEEEEAGDDDEGTGEVDEVYFIYIYIVCDPRNEISSII
jgi:hypothetical protein